MTYVRKKIDLCKKNQNMQQFFITDCFLYWLYSNLEPYFEGIVHVKLVSKLKHYIGQIFNQLYNQFTISFKIFKRKNAMFNIKL